MCGESCRSKVVRQVVEDMHVSKRRVVLDKQALAASQYSNDDAQRCAMQAFIVDPYVLTLTPFSVYVIGTRRILIWHCVPQT